MCYAGLGGTRACSASRARMCVKAVVLKVDRKKNRILVEKINMVKRHSKPTNQNRQGGIIEKEMPIQWSNVMVMCGKCVGPARIKIQRLEDGNKVRVCVKCNEALDT